MQTTAPSPEHGQAKRPKNVHPVAVQCGLMVPVLSCAKMAMGTERVAHLVARESPPETGMETDQNLVLEFDPPEMRRANAMVARKAARELGLWPPPERGMETDLNLVLEFDPPANARVGRQAARELGFWPPPETVTESAQNVV